MIALFLTFITAALILGCYLGNRWARVGREIDSRLTEHRCGWEVNDACDEAETAADWGYRL